MDALKSAVKKPPLVIALGILLYFIALAALSRAAPVNPLSAILFFVVWLLAFETSLRSLLRLLYGKQYRFALYNYFLIDHKIYGNVFRPGADTRTIAFPLFDRFVLRANIKPSRSLSENKKDRVSFSVNSRGFRGKEFSTKKQAGVVRIFCSGGSTTACNSVNDDEAWPAALERELAKKGLAVEVINAGVQGWYSYQELLRFQNEIINCEPDAVLLHQGWNEEFNYSSQNLGAWWKPREVRNVIEEKYLYSGKHPILSSTRSILFFFIMRAYFKNIVFDRNMSFSNPRRWECLKKMEYMEAWVKTLIDFARIASERGILLYAINAPGLSDFNDVRNDRLEYIRRTRLTEHYADYQAVSKRRITNTLRAASPIIPMIDVEKSFSHLRGTKRAALFQDDIHLSEKGNALLAESVGEYLLNDTDFRNRLKIPGRKKSNIAFDEATTKKIQKTACANPSYIDAFIDKKINSLLAHAAEDDESGVPDERYTTF